jgi:hypothetical protein
VKLTSWHTSNAKSKNQLGFKTLVRVTYDWRTANRFVLKTSPLRLTTNHFIFQMNTCGYNPYVTYFLTRELACRLQLLLVLARAVILRYESCGTHDHFLLSQIRDSPQPIGPGPRIYIPQEQGGPLIPVGTVFPFLRLLGLAGLRWRYSIPSLHGYLLKTGFLLNNIKIQFVPHMKSITSALQKSAG